MKETNAGSSQSSTKPNVIARQAFIHNISSFVINTFYFGERGGEEKIDDAWVPKLDSTDRVFAQGVPYYNVDTNAFRSSTRDPKLYDDSTVGKVVADGKKRRELAKRTTTRSSNASTLNFRARKLNVWYPSSSK